MMKDWLLRLEIKVDAVMTSNAEKRWHAPAIKGLIGVMAALCVFILVSSLVAGE